MHFSHKWHIVCHKCSFERSCQAVMLLRNGKKTALKRLSFTSSIVFKILLLFLPHLSFVFLYSSSGQHWQIFSVNHRNGFYRFSSHSNLSLSLLRSTNAWVCIWVRQAAQQCSSSVTVTTDKLTVFSWSVLIQVFLSFSILLNLSFLSNFSQCGSSSGRLHLLPELLALFVPVASLRLTDPFPEGVSLPHLQCGYGHGISAHRNVWRQRWDFEVM